MLRLVVGKSPSGSASSADYTVASFSFSLTMVCFTFVSGFFTTISWSDDRVVSGRAVASVISVLVF